MEWRTVCIIIGAIFGILLLLEFIFGGGKDIRGVFGLSIGLGIMLILWNAFKRYRKSVEEKAFALYDEEAEKEAEKE